MKRADRSGAMVGTSFELFAEALAQSAEDAETIDLESATTELWGACWAALGAAPSKDLLSEVIFPYYREMDLSRFLVMAIGRSPAMDEVLGPVLSRRLRHYLFVTNRPGADPPPVGSPAPGEEPWELNEALLGAKAEAARAAKRGAPVDLVTMAASRRSKATRSLFPFLGGGRHIIARSVLQTDHTTPAWVIEKGRF